MTCLLIFYLICSYAPHSRILTHQNNSQNSIPKVMAIFPAKNEEGTIENSIATAKQSYYKPDVILVDAFSTDKTTQLAVRAGAIVIQQPTKIFPAKGLAMKAGLREAFDRSADIVVAFVSATLTKSLLNTRSIFILYLYAFSFEFHRLIS